MKHKLSIALLIASSLSLSSLPAFSQMQSSSVGSWLDHAAHKVEGTVKKVALPVIGFAGRTLQGENKFGKVGLAGGAAAGGGLTGGSGVCGMGDIQAMELLEAWIKNPSNRQKLKTYQSNYCHTPTATNKSNTKYSCKSNTSFTKIVNSIKRSPKAIAMATEISSNEIRCVIEAGMMDEDG